MGIWTDETLENKNILIQDFGRLLVFLILTIILLFIIILYPIECWFWDRSKVITEILELFDLAFT